LKLLLDDASYQKKGLEQIFSDLLKTSEEQLSTDDFTNIRRRLDEIQKLEDTNFRRSEMQSLKGMESNPKLQLIPPRTQW
jgi:hypothetical protein